MPCITLVEQFYHVQKMQECGMLWEAVMRKLENQHKHKNAMKGLSARKIDRE